MASCMRVQQPAARHTARDVASKPDETGFVQALEHAGLTWETPDSQLDPARCGILIGTAMGGMHTFSTAVEDLTQRVRAHSLVVKPETLSMACTRSALLWRASRRGCVLSLLVNPEMFLMFLDWEVMRAPGLSTCSHLYNW